MAFSTSLKQRDINNGRVYIEESDATTLFGYPPDASMPLVLSSNSFGQKDIVLCRDGNRYYFEIRRWMNLRDGSTITMSKIRARSTNQKKEFKFEVTNN
jgi:hypothetical protein